MDIEKKKAEQGRSWDHIESDLKDALNTWSDLTEELAGKISPEEEQLREIKSLLGTLRDKLKEFSDDTNEGRQELSKAEALLKREPSATGESKPRGDKEI